MASRSPDASVTRRIPRPPPPDTALTNNGNCMDSDAVTNSSTEAEGSEDASTGNPAALAAAMARALFPVSSNTSADGPTNVMPSATHAAASSGFSERKP